jgi:NAD(P)-dependent dehydrogenase (short-subunit alcohol dehydrogenase family)
MKVGVAGATSTIAAEFCKLLPPTVEPYCDRLIEMPDDLDRYLICTGFLSGKHVSCISNEEAETTFRRNFLEPARFCERVFLRNPQARICLIGSESGFRGSFDMAYAGAKAALHLYVETRQLAHPEQQLVCLSPTIIADSRMTEARSDHQAVEARARATRHGRWIKAREVAAQAYQALFIASPFLSNTVIRMRGEVP